MAYLTAGDPTLEASEKIILAAAEAGADVIELGVPFSDPVADGPTIQRASERALQSGTTLAGVLDLRRAPSRAHRSAARPLQLFQSHPADGPGEIRPSGERLRDRRRSGHGFDAGGIGRYRAIVRAQALDTIFLGAPTSTDARLAAIAECSSGFLYLISRTGVTGTRESLPEELPALVRRARRVTKLPIAVGFGISLPEHVSVLGGIADAAVVGSALVAEVEQASKSKLGPEAAPKAVADRIRLLKSAARRGISTRDSKGD